MHVKFKYLLYLFCTGIWKLSPSQAVGDGDGSGPSSSSSNDKNSFISSTIDCTGLNQFCKTFQGEPSCRLMEYSKPLHPIICYVENACLTTNLVLTLYSDEIIHKAFQSLKISTAAFGTKDGIRNPITFDIKPARDRPTDKVFNPELALFVGSTDNENPGHILGDIMLPLFRMLSTYNAVKEKFHVVFLVEYVRFITKSENFDKFFRHMSGKNYTLVNKGPDDLPAVFDQKCYKKIIVGNSDMSYSEGMQDARAMSDFRDFMVKDAKDVILNPEHPTVTVILRAGWDEGSDKCQISNVDEIDTYIRDTFPRVQVRTHDWAHKDLEEQIQIMQNTDIVFSHGGADLMNSIFLKDGSTIFNPCRKIGCTNDGREIDHSNDIRIWFTAMPRVTSVEYCGPDDVAYFEGKSIINIALLPLYFPSVIRDWYIRRGGIYPPPETSSTAIKNTSN